MWPAGVLWRPVVFAPPSLLLYPQCSSVKSALSQWMQLLNLTPCRSVAHNDPINSEVAFSVTFTDWLLIGPCTSAHGVAWTVVKGAGEYVHVIWEVHLQSISSVQIPKLIIFIKKPQLQKNYNYFIRQGQLVTYIYIYEVQWRSGVVHPTHSQPGTTRRWLVSTRPLPLYPWERHATPYAGAFGSRDRSGQHGKSRLDLDSVPGASSPWPISWPYVVVLNNFR
jgi:hypothetical protein